MSATAAIAALTELGAHRLPHRLGTLGEHLLTTMAILAGWNAPEEVCLAGLYHSIYGTEVFTEQLLAPTPEHRQRIARIIGGEAERLAYLYCAIKRQELLAMTVRPRSGGVVTVECRDGMEEDVLPLIWPDQTALYLLNLANDMAQSQPRATTFATPEVLGHLRLSTYLAGMMGNQEQPRMKFYLGLRAQPWWDVPLPLAQDLAAASTQIADEVRGLRKAAFQPEAENIERQGDWAVAFLYERGKPHEDILRQLPTAASILERHRAIRTQTGLVYVSSLGPHSQVKSHRGPTNMRLRLHLPLVVPAGDARLKVGVGVQEWRPGECLVFDDSFPHEVWNNTDEERLVLVADLWHPDLTDHEAATLAGLDRYAMASAQDMEGYWLLNQQAKKGVAVEAAAAPVSRRAQRRRKR